MNGITIEMALVDFIPVLLFFLAAVILLKDLYNKFGKAGYAIFATGSIMVLISGIYKALWKILYALQICDFEILSISFFSVQSPGYIFVFLSLAVLLYQSRRSKGVIYSAGLVPVVHSKLIFIIIQTLGCTGFLCCLYVMARRRKSNKSAALFLISLCFMLTMGYLSSRFTKTPSMHWIAQITNIIGNAALLWGVQILHKNGLCEEKSLSCQ